MFKVKAKDTRICLRKIGITKNTTANTRYKQVGQLAQFEVGLVFEKNSN